MKTNEKTQNELQAFELGKARALAIKTRFPNEYKSIIEEASPLSGEFADDETPQSLSARFNAYYDELDALCEEYENGFNSVVE